MTDVTVDELLTKKLLIRQYAVETDIHPFVKGATFGNVWKNKVRAEFGNTFVWFASLEDLIKMKRAAGRTQDLEDLKYLLRLRKRKSKTGMMKLALRSGRIYPVGDGHARPVAYPPALCGGACSAILICHSEQLNQNVIFFFLPFKLNSES